MRYWYDTEFIERGFQHPVDGISWGVKAEDGRKYYAISAEFNMYAAWHKVEPDGTYWLRENVIRHLPLVRNAEDEILFDVTGTPRIDHSNEFVKSRRQIAAELKKFFRLDEREKYGDPELWAWYADYDHVVLCQLFGTMAQLPEGMPMYTNDLKQEVARAGNPPMPKQVGDEHHALSDAEHLEQMWLRAANLGIVHHKSIQSREVLNPRPIRDSPQA